MSRTVRATRSSSRLAATPGPSKKSGPSVVPVEATTVSGARTVATRRSRRPLARSARKKRAQPDESEIELDLLQCTLAEIKLEVDSRCAKLNHNAEELLQQLENALCLKLITLTEKQKTARIGDLLAAASGAGGSENLTLKLPRAGTTTVQKRQRVGMTFARPSTGAPPLPPATTKKSLGVASMVTPRRSVRIGQSSFLTPAGPHGNVSRFTPATRRAKKGESVLSLNGSPLGPVATTALSTPAVAVELSTGHVITTAEGAEVHKLDNEGKAEARRKLMEIQQQVTAMINQLAQ